MRQSERCVRYTDEDIQSRAAIVPPFESVAPRGQGNRLRGRRAAGTDHVAPVRP